MSKKLQGKISASMMCADLVHLKEDIELFEAMNIDFLHIDVMDGAFVPNYGLGVDYIRGLHELTHIPDVYKRQLQARLKKDNIYVILIFVGMV